MHEIYHIFICFNCLELPLHYQDYSFTHLFLLLINCFFVTVLKLLSTKEQTLQSSRVASLPNESYRDQQQDCSHTLSSNLSIWPEKVNKII